MLDTLLKWIGPWLLKRLAAVLDPDSAKRSKALLDRSNALDIQEEEMSRKESEFTQKLHDSELRQVDLQKKIDQIDSSIKKEEGDLASRKIAIANQSDHDSIRGDV